MDLVKAIVKFDTQGNSKPVRFVHNDKVISVEQILSVTEENLVGNRMKVFDCQSEIDGELKRYVLKYELATGKWFLVAPG